MGDLCNRKLTKEQLEQIKEQEKKLFDSQPSEEESKESSEEDSKESDVGSDNEKHFKSSSQIKKKNGKYDSAFKPK